MDILARLAVLTPALSATTIHQLHLIILALLAMTGRVTMLGLSRWAGPGGSYRTSQRFFTTNLPWPLLCWLFVRTYLLDPDAVYLLAGDEVVVTKAGKKTQGRDYFVSSIYQKTLPSLAFFSLALLSTPTGRAYPLRLHHVERTQQEKAARQAETAAKKNKRARTKHPPARPTDAPHPLPAAPAAGAPAPPPAKRKPGRPKGSTTKSNAAPAAPTPAPPPANRKPGRPKGATNTPQPRSLSAELQRIQSMLLAQLKLMGGLLPLVYLVLDGHFGNAPSLLMVLSCGLQLISKLRHDAALYFPFAGTYAGRGPHPKYGDKLNVAAIPATYLVESTQEGEVETSIYQAEMWHKEFRQRLNVVIIVRTNTQTQAQGHVILFSSDLRLGYEKVMEYYSLRFHIEFTFREAKQNWGLEDFMNVTATGVRNAANLALFMVNVSALLLQEARRRDPTCSVLDLKAQYRGYQYVAATIKMLPEKPQGDFIRRIYQRVASLGRIHPAESLPNAA